MNNDFKTLYKALNIICDLSKDESSVCLRNNIKLCFRKISTNNKYFFEIDVIATENLNYTEFRVRVWNNQMSEVVKYKKAESFKYQNIYVSRYGLEIANKELQIDANQALLDLLRKI